MKTFFILSFGTFLILVFIGLNLQGGNTQSHKEAGTEEISWKIVTIDGSVDLNSMGHATSIAVDGANKLHVVYGGSIPGAYINNYLRHATNKSGKWKYSTIAKDKIKRFISMAVDSKNRIHVCFQDQAYLSLLTLQNGKWIKSIISNAGGYYPSIAIDASDKIHVCYGNIDYSTAIDYLRYATNKSGDWSICAIDKFPNQTLSTCTLSSIAVDKKNKVHMSYCNSADLRLKYATNESGSWKKAAIKKGKIGGISLVLDKKSISHICFYDYDKRILKYTTNSSGKWRASIIDNQGDVGRDVSLAMDKNNKLHVAYYDMTNRDLKYATNRSGKWEIQVIESEGDVGFFPTIAVDSDNYVHIAYGFYNYSKKILKYATTKNSTG